MVGRDTGHEWKPLLYDGQHLCAQPNGIDKVDDIRLKLLQAANEAWPHKVELETGVDYKWQAKSAHYIVAGVLALRAMEGGVGRWQSQK